MDALDSAKNSKHQSVTAKREKSQTPMFVQIRLGQVRLSQVRLSQVRISKVSIAVKAFVVCDFSRLAVTDWRLWRWRLWFLTLMTATLTRPHLRGGLQARGMARVAYRFSANKKKEQPVTCAPSMLYLAFKKKFSFLDMFFSLQYSLVFLSAKGSITFSTSTGISRCALNKAKPLNRYSPVEFRTYSTSDPL